ncbi:MAG: phage tail tube protein [Pseudomonadota bacterium]
MSKKLTGRAEVFVDGKKLEMENGATLNPGGYTRSPERHGGDTYYTEDEIAPSVDGVLLHTADADLISLSNITGATLMFHCDTGQKYMLRGAFVTEPVALDAKAGKAPIKFAARSCDKV